MASRADFDRANADFDRRADLVGRLHHGAFACLYAACAVLAGGAIWAAFTASDGLDVLRRFAPVLASFIIGNLAGEALVQTGRWHMRRMEADVELMRDYVRSAD